MQYQIHYEKKFYEDKKTGYWISTVCPKIRAHRWVWTNVYGSIPKGMHIHHKDHDKSNNQIENLELHSPKSHLQLHLTETRLEESRKRMQEIVRPKADIWHGSIEGVEWHKKHAETMGFGKWECKSYFCECCSEKYYTSKQSNFRFCSNKCKSASRRKSGVDEIDIVCEKCKVIFKRDKYAKQRFCSRSCGSGRRKG